MLLGVQQQACVGGLRSLTSFPGAACLCRPLWDLHRCLLTLEYASFACPANEQELVHMCLELPNHACSCPYQDRPAQSNE